MKSGWRKIGVGREGEARAAPGRHDKVEGICTVPSDKLKRAAETLLVRAAQKKDAPIATDQYRAEEQTIRDRTVKLRKDRLGREAAAKK